MRPKTTTASFRLDESAPGVLQEDAREQNISVNALINQLVLACANYDRPMKSINSRTNRKFFARLSPAVFPLGFSDII